MGVWSYGTLDSDLALDLKFEYESLLDLRRSHEEVVQELVEEFDGDNKEDFDTYILFWPALAELQIKHGFILKEVKEKTLHIIDNDFKLKEVWGEDSELRREELLELKERILHL